MSAIGEYIHFTAYGYAHFGIKRMQGNTKGDNDFAAVLNNQKNKIDEQCRNLNILSPREKIKIENTISSLMVSDSIQAKEKGIAEAWEAICEKLKIDFYDTVANDVVANTGQVSTKGVRIKDNTKSGNFLSTFLDRAKKINNLISAIHNEMKRQVLSQKIEAINTELQNLLNITEESLKEFFQGEGSARDFLKDIKNKDTILQKEGLRNLINECANIIKGLNNYTKGAMFEMLVSIATDRLEKKGKMTAVQAVQSIEKHRIGDQKSGVFISSANFAVDPKKFLSANYKQKNLKTKYGENLQGYISDNETQNKVDVTFQWHGKTINTSVKNVNLYAFPSVSLVDTTSFLVLLQSMDFDFVNHYLNIMTTHYSMPASQYSNAINFTEQKDMYYKIKDKMNLSLLLSAFIGHKINADTANVFIINNIGASGKDKKVKVFNIEDLIQRANKNPQIIQIEGLGQLFLNRFSPTIEDRIASILSQVHAEKITIGISRKAFSEMIH